MATIVKIVNHIDDGGSKYLRNVNQFLADDILDYVSFQGYLCNTKKFTAW
jgi:hypothetical protein